MRCAVVQASAGGHAAVTVRPTTLQAPGAVRTKTAASQVSLERPKRLLPAESECARNETLGPRLVRRSRTFERTESSGIARLEIRLLASRGRDRAKSGIRDGDLATNASRGRNKRKRK